MDKINKWFLLSSTTIFNLIPIFFGPKQIESSSSLVALIFFTLIFGTYALQFILAPTFMLTIHFEKNFDEYHYFISRLFGCSSLFCIISLWFIEYEISFRICATYLLCTSICGPLYAEAFLQPKKIHKIAHISTFILTLLYVCISIF